MSSSKAARNRDLVIRFDPATKVISLHTMSPSGEPMTIPVHQIRWERTSGFESVIDTGAGVCAHLFSRYTDDFCTEDDWQKIASDIRIATGRDDEE